MVSTLLLYSFLVSFVSAQCFYSYPSSECSTNTLFVLDATNYLTNTDINNELNFTMSSLLPYFGFPMQEATIVAYGSGSQFTPLTSIYSIACAQLNNLIQDVNSHGGQRATLTSLVNQIYQDYRDFIGPGFTIQLFSGSTDASDINSAAMFVRNNMYGVQFTIISLTNSVTYWNNFPYSQIYARYPWSLDYNLGQCLVSNSCGANKCQQSTYPPATSPTTTRRATTPLPTTTTPGITYEGPQCQCNYNTSWNDIMFLFESTSTVSYNGLQELLGYVQTSLTYFNVQAAGNNTTPYHTRIGMITYSDSVQLRYSLGSLSYYQLQSLNQIGYTGGYGTNLNLAFQYATNELFGSNSRPNARPVIVILGSSYSRGSYPLPQTAANNFKNAGGVVIVYDYTQQAGVEPVLQGLTTSGYFIVNTNDNGHRLQDGLCDANCRCGTYSYSSDPTTGKPIAGCYTPVETLGNYQVATNKCSLIGGTIAQEKTYQKTTFLESLFSVPSSFLAGMKWDSMYGLYRWVDGTPVNGPYQPWYGGNQTHQQGKDCVYVYNNGGNLQWVGTDCRNGFFYPCLTSPCDSTHYC